MTLLDQRIFRFAEVEMCPPQGQLRRAGQELHLRQKSFAVLIYLIEHRDRCVAKDELLEQLWPEAAVTDDSLVQCIIDIRKALGDNSRRPKFIKTIPRLGYRFIAEVEELTLDQNNPSETLAVTSVEIESIEIEYEEDLTPPPVAPAAVPLNTGSSRRALPPALRSRRRLIASLVLALSLIGVGAFYLSQRLNQADPSAVKTTLPHIPGKKGLVVLHFENQSGQENLNWLREGLADMLIAKLSGWESLTVLSRPQLNLLLQRVGYQPGQNFSLEQTLAVAERSRADVIVQGSFAQLGQKVRLEARLHDGQNGQLLAAESLILDQPEQLLFQIDLFSLKLAGHLGVIQPAPVREYSLAQVMTNDLAAYRYYSLALEKLSVRQNTEAIALLKQAVAQDPQFAMAYAQIGYAYAVNWNLAAEARPYLEKAFHLSDQLTERDRLYVAAWYAIANLAYQAAITSLRQVIDRYPMESDAYLTLGRLLEGEEQYDEAIQVFKQGIVVDPAAKELYNALGLLYSGLGRHNEAIGLLQYQVTLAPDDPNAHDSLGLAYQWAGRFAEAQAAYQQALALAPDFELATVHLGNLYFQQGRYQAALGQYQRYIGLAKSDLERGRGYGRLAWLYWRKGELPKAVEAASRELNYEPTAVWNSAVLALAQGNDSRAARLARQSDTFNYTTRGTRTSGRYRAFFLGYMALQRGQTNEAVAHFKQALDHRPPIWATDPYEDCLANAYLALGRLDEARAEYERLLQLNPNYPLARYHLAQIYERQGDLARARAEYQRFLDIWQTADPDIPEVITAKERLSRPGAMTGS